MENKATIHRFLGSGPSAKKKTDNGTVKVPIPVTEAFSKLARAKVELATFCNANARLVEQLGKLREEVEAATDEAKGMYIQYKDRLGPSYEGFSIGRKRYINATKLVELQPEMTKYMKHSITVGVFESLVAAGTIHEKTAEQVDSYTEDVSAPRK